MGLNEADTRIQLMTLILMLVIGMSTLLQFLENQKLDDEPVKTPFTPIFATTSSNYSGTASGTTTTL
ncbi:hypothetical protein HYS95_00790 [Candidatus Daviesbacteria bacterium]|nr:hypothetical protein [Candidatus Daviesbacteria bacterium]